VLKRALLTAALLTFTFALAPAGAQLVSDEVFIPGGFDPFETEVLWGAAGVACTDAGLVQEPLPDEAEGFSIPGEFLLVKDDDLCRSFTVPLRLGVPYKAIYVDFDLELDRWVTNIFHNISSLRRTASKRNARVLYYGLIIRGDKRRTILDLGAEKQVKQDHPWQEHTKYHITMETNLPGKRIKMDVFDADGNWVFGTQGKMTAREIKNLGGDKEVKIDFSSGGIAFHAYFPPTGWSYSNLKVTAVP
jgi:hypothetical protein